MGNKNVEVMRGNPETAVKKLAIPIMISMLLTASYNIIDGIWIAGLGQEAIAGIGFITPIFMILNGVSVGLGSGATNIKCNFRSDMYLHFRMGISRSSYCNNFKFSLFSCCYIVLDFS